MEIFNGLIVWYQRPLNGITGLTGLFNILIMQSWLNVIWPLCIATLLDKNKYFTKYIYLLFYFYLNITILTNSRSAWLGFLLGAYLFLKKVSNLL